LSLARSLRVSRSTWPPASHWKASARPPSNSDSNRSTYAEAIEAYKRALDCDPDFADAHCNLGSVYFNQDRIASSRICFERALVIDPHYAQAWLGIAWTYAFLADAYLLPAVAYDSAKLAAHRALDYDSLTGDTYVLLGYASYATDWNLENADRLFRRGVELSPNSADVHTFHANWLCFVGQIDDGLAAVDRAIALDRLSTVASFVREWCLYLGRRYDELIVQHAKTMALDSTFLYMDWFVGAAYREQGRYAEALAEYRRAQDLAGEQPLHGYAITYARMGRTGEAREILGRLEAYARTHYVNPIFLAEVHASLAEKDLAFEWLERAYNQRDAGLAEMKGDPLLHKLERDPRYSAFLKKMNLPPD